MTYYPLNLDLRGKKCLVVGGGVIAERKVASLLSCKGDITVLSLTLTPTLSGLAKEGHIKYLERSYRRNDAAGYFIVICATNDATVNAQAAKDARTYGALANCVDDPGLCDFFVPAQVRRGELLFTVSTGGKSPTLTKYLAKELAERYKEEYGLYLEFMATMRSDIKACLNNSKAREAFWQQLFTAEVKELLQSGNLKEAEARIQDAVSCIRLKS